MSGTNLFAVARDRGWDWRDILDLSVNINPLGMAPGVRAAIERAIDRVPHYPEPEPLLLREELAARWGAGPEEILLGNGAAELIHFLARVWTREVATIAVPAPPEYLRAHPLARRVEWSEPGHWATSGLMIVAQPNPYTGHLIASERLREYLKLGSNPVIVDETLLDFSDEPSVIPLAKERPNLFVIRSLSGFHALAGLRVGALAGDRANIASLAAKREPYQINVLAKAAALESLRDSEHAARSRRFLEEERKWMWSQLQRIPSITPVHSEAGFFLVYLTSGAAELCAWLLERKIMILDCTGVPGVEGSAVRLAIGTREGNERILARLREYFGA